MACFFASFLLVSSSSELSCSGRLALIVAFPQLSSSWPPPLSIAPSPSARPPFVLLPNAPARYSIAPVSPICPPLTPLSLHPAPISLPPISLPLASPFRASHTQVSLIPLARPLLARHPLLLQLLLQHSSFLPLLSIQNSWPSPPSFDSILSVSRCSYFRALSSFLCFSLSMIRCVLRDTLGLAPCSLCGLIQVIHCGNAIQIIVVVLSLVSPSPHESKLLKPSASSDLSSNLQFGLVQTSLSLSPRRGRSVLQRARDAAPDARSPFARPTEETREDVLAGEVTVADVDDHRI